MSWPARWRWAVNAGLGRAGFEDVLQIGADVWKGRAHEDLEAMGERLFEEKIGDLVYPETRALVQAHHRPGSRGRALLVGDGVPGRCGGRGYLGIERVLCNRYRKRGRHPHR